MTLGARGNLRAGRLEVLVDESMENRVLCAAGLAGSVNDPESSRHA